MRVDALLVVHINYTKGKISLMSLEVDLYAAFSFMCAMSFSSKFVVAVVICCRRHDASTHCIKIAQ